jgi:isoleucyl-tRNA synthetase
VPGWDCHGLPIENKALKDSAVCLLSFSSLSIHSLIFEQLDPLVTPASEIRRAARATALREIDSQREQFRQLGIMADWDSKERTYRTIGLYILLLGLRTHCALLIT